MIDIAIIGAGNMGASLSTAFSKTLPATEYRITVVDRHSEKLSSLSGVQTTTSLEDVRKAKVCVVAVKPKSFSSVAPFCRSASLVVSVMAGVCLAELQSKTGVQFVIRAMPNLGVEVERAVTGWVASEQVQKSDKEMVDQIFSSLGESLCLEKEEMMDSITALFGSGPAYFFFLAELLKKNAEGMGLSADQAEKMASMTLIGSGYLQERGKKTLQEWQDAVASKGGTTESALQALEQSCFAQDFSHAVQAAKHRAVEMKNGY